MPDKLDINGTDLRGFSEHAARYRTPIKRQQKHSTPSSTFNPHSDICAVVRRIRGDGHGVMDGWAD